MPDPANIRLRIANNRVELCVEDLRASGDKDLIRLAEVDRVRSTSMWTRGDDDGWVTTAEVNAASGLHFSIAEGYDELCREAERRGAPAIPVAEARDLIRQSSGPRKKSPPPVEEPRPFDAIRAPASVDPAGARPHLLADLESRLDRAISEARGFESVYRGFSLDEYGGPEMVRYLFGDWSCVIGSHTFTADLRERVASGVELHRAVRATATALADDIVAAIDRDGVVGYMQAQSRATQIGIRDKKATAMASYADSPLDGPSMTPNSFSYARTGYHGLVHARVVSPSQPAIMVEVDQKVRRDLGMTEHYIPSHVPPTRVRRFFLGFSNMHDVRLYERPPARKEAWYQVEILGRDESGRPTGFAITPATSTVSGVMESWTLASRGWRSGSADPAADHAFATEHPMLAATIAEIRQQLAAL